MTRVYIGTLSLSFSPFFFSSESLSQAFLIYGPEELVFFLRNRKIKKEPWRLHLPDMSWVIVCKEMTLEFGLLLSLVGEVFFLSFLSVHLT